MKTHISRLLIWFAFVWGIAIPSHAQVFLAANLHAQDVIIRNIDNTRSVIYGYDPQAAQAFFAFDNGSSIIFYFYLPQYTYVRDMEVMNDHLYFCGSRMGDGMIGEFSIFPFFGGNISPVILVRCGPNYYEDPYYVHVTEYTRMEVFEDPSGFLTYALTGNSIIDQYEPVSRTIVSAASQVNNTFEFYHLYNKDGYVSYSDIAVLDDAVVAVGSHDGSGCLMKTFRRVYDFTHQPLNSAYVTSIFFYGADGPSLVTHVDSNKCVVAHHFNGRSTTFFHRLKLDLLTGRPTMHEQSLFLSTFSPVPYSNPLWKLYDLRHERGLVLLENADHSGTGNFGRWLLYPIVNSSPATIYGQNLLSGNQISVDFLPTSLYATTAGNVSPGFLSKYQPLFPTITSSCNTATQHTVLYGNPTFTDVSVSLDYPFFIYNTMTYIPTLENTGKHIICN